MELSALFVVAESAVRDAGSIAHDYFSIGSPLTTTAKPDGSPVTEADIRISRFIQDRLTTAFPAIPFLSEETAHEAVDTSGDMWVLDPIDATANFAAGNPHFSISLAYVVSGKPLIGIVYAPAEEKWYMTSAGSDSSQDLRTQQIRASDTLAGSRILLDTGTRPDTVATHARLRAAFENEGAIVESRSCASIDIAAVGYGEFDAYVHRGLQVWDIAAAIAIARDAGAAISDMAGNEKDIFTSGIIVANPSLYAHIVTLVNHTLD